MFLYITFLLSKEQNWFLKCVNDSLVFVRLVVSHVTVPQKGSLDKDRQGTPAEQNDSQL